MLGHLLRRGGVPSLDFWNLNDKLVYWVLMPALLFRQMSTATFDAELVSDYAVVILGSFAAALAVGLGVAWNFAFDAAPAPVLHDVARILGAAALPIVLMCVGANLRFRAMAVSVLPIAISTVAKMAVFPLAVLALARLVGLSETQTMVALLFGAAPTASSAYTLARQLGGDAPLMAAIMTVQTAIAFISLPATLAFVSGLLAVS